MKRPRLLLAFALAPGLVAAGADLRVSPPQATPRIAAGEPATFSFELVSGADALVRPGFADFDLDRAGEAVLESGPRSCSRRARVNPEEVALRAREPQVVRVRVDMPPEARGTYWCFVTFDLRPGAAAPRGGTVVQLAPRLSVPLFVTVGETPWPRVGVRFDAASRKAGEIVASLAFANPGPNVVRLAGVVTLEETGGAAPVEVGEQRVPRFVLLPEHERRVDVRLRAGGGRPVRLRATFDTEGAAEGRVLAESEPIP